MEYNSNFKYDLKVGKQAENELAEILMDKTLEVKWDKQCRRTGNVYIEYQSRGKPSGIVKSEANYWAIKLDNNSFIIKNRLALIKRIEELVQSKEARTNVKGGDSNTSLGYLVKYTDII